LLRPFDDLPKEDKRQTTHTETITYLVNRVDSVGETKHIFYNQYWEGFFSPRSVIELK